MKKSRQFEVDTSVYPLEAVQSACYRFIDRAYLRVERGDGRTARVLIKPKEGDVVADELADEFHNELLHQTLRLRVSGNNQKIRELIVTKALVSAQPAAGPASDCPECRQESAGGTAAPAAAAAATPSAPAVDAELEAEIDKLLAEIEKGGEDKDPLDVVVPWEEKHASEKQPEGKK